MTANFYKVLGVPENASSDDIRAAYRRLTQQFHPDLHEGNEHAETMFKWINEAYTVLGDSKARARYDLSRGQTGTNPPSYPRSSPRRGAGFAGLLFGLMGGYATSTGDGVDRVKVTAGLLATSWGGALVGYAVGMYAAKPVFDSLTIVGVAATGGVVAAALVILSRILRRRLSLRYALIHYSIHPIRGVYQNLTRPITGDRKGTAKWLIATTVAGAIVGLGSGFGIGLRTAQSLLNALTILGWWTLIAIALATIAIILLLIAQERMRIDSRRRKYRRRYRYRRYY